MQKQDNWEQLTPDEKLIERFKALEEASNINFINNEVEVKYKKAVQRLEDIIKLNKPDRVPISLSGGYFPARFYGITIKEAMYDYTKASKAWLKFNAEFNLDYISSMGAACSGPMMKKLDLKLYKWSGNGTDENTPFQCVEREYMKEDEYEELINDPGTYLLRNYLPRIMGSVSSWTKLPSPLKFIELPFIHSSMISLGNEGILASFEKFLDAAREAADWAKVLQKTNKKIIATQGLPPVSGGFTKAPFDIIGDTLRGTKKIMLDIFRCPEKILTAVEKLVPLAIDLGVNSVRDSKHPIVQIPLHKGDDNFLSHEQYARFYWPTLKKVILGLINEGIVPLLFVEGTYNTRLEFLADPDLPAGRIYCLFDKTDIIRAHKYLKGKIAIGGNVPSSLMSTGTPDEVEEYVKKLIKNVGGNGGFMLSPGADVGDSREENIRAFIEVGRKYGEY